MNNQTSYWVVRRIPSRNNVLQKSLLKGKDFLHHGCGVRFPIERIPQKSYVIRAEIN
jgi:hypothetical protein